ncbi:hypothetical protein, partial [Clostridioides difficile]|uniref:hypothetical protein n=1 Tax=Clostridioides difficile TaxID=1496 RepID=UPI001A984F81
MGKKIDTYFEVNILLYFSTFLLKRNILHYLLLFYSEIDLIIIDEVDNIVWRNERSTPIERVL